MKKIHLLLIVIILVCTGMVAYLLGVNKPEHMNLSFYYPVHPGYELAPGEVLGTWTGFLSDPKATCIAGVNQVALSWTAQRNAKNYSVRRFDTQKRQWATIASNINSTQYTDSSFSSAATGKYSYQITATVNRKTIYSNTKTVSLLSCQSAPPAPTPTPAPTPAPTPSPAPSPSPSTESMQWGTYTGWEDTALANFEARIGKPVNYQAVFIGWGVYNEFPASLAKSLKPAGKTLVIFWEPSDENVASTSQPKFSYDSIMSGTWDSYLASFAASAKAYGGPVIMVPFEEMNGDWYPWSGTQNGNTPAKAAAGFCYARKFFADAPNVKFGWAPNSTSWPNTSANNLTAYYPGDSCVDYVGLDGFNFGGPWESFGQIFDDALASIAQYNKPAIIFSMASAEGPNKPAWITDALKVQIPKHPQIKGWIWFNQNKERNWLVWSSNEALAAFQNAIASY